MTVTRRDPQCGRRRLAAGWLGVLLIGLAGCTSTPPTQDDAPATVRVRLHLPSAPDSLTMIGKHDRNGEIVASQLTDALVTFNAELELVPQLAQSWKLEDGGRTVEFRLQEGARWHDGAPVTAEDVLATVHAVRDPATENRSFLPLFEELEEITALDPSTVRATFRTATPDMLEAWRLPIVPAHLAGTGEALLTGEFSRNPVGCGPFRFVRYRRDEELVLAANDDYWGGRPRIDELVIRFYPDMRTAYQELENGGLDIMTGTAELYTQALERADPRIETYVYERLTSWSVFWNQRKTGHPAFRDPRVRRAMVMALDRDSFSKNVLRGIARTGVTTYAPLPGWSDPDLQPLPFDVAAAAALLEEAGWVDTDGDGIRDRDGVEFSFEYTFPTSSQRTSAQMAEWQQAAWRDLGIEARLEQLEWTAFRAKRDTRKFDVVAFSINVTSPDQRELYHSRFDETGFNLGGLADAEVDRLIEQGRRTFDQDERRRIYFRLQRRLSELQPASSLFHYSTPLMHDRRLRGVTPSPMDHLRIDRGPRVWWWSEEPES